MLDISSTSVRLPPDISLNGVFDMQHSLGDVCFFDIEDNQYPTPVKKSERIKNVFEKVFSDLKDINGNTLTGRAKFKESFIETLEKCDIENSMDLIYKMLGKNIKLENNLYYKDDMDAELPKDVATVIEMINHLHAHRVPKKFVAGFLLLMVRFVHFPINN